MAFTLLTLLTLSAAATEFTSGKLRYVVNDDGATVTVVGEGTPLKAEKGPGGLTVHLPPAYANAAIPFALKVSRQDGNLL